MKSTNPIFLYGKELTLDMQSLWVAGAMAEVEQRADIPSLNSRLKIIREGQ